jgi:hypothetical protein
MAGRGPEIGERAPEGERSPISGYSLSFREVLIILEKEKSYGKPKMVHQSD